MSEPCCEARRKATEALDFLLKAREEASKIHQETRALVRLLDDAIDKLWEPIEVRGEPLSRTILKERR
jgi:hypothetical protein